MTSSRDTLNAFTDAAAAAVARAIAGLQREAARERELRDAEHRATLAELARAIASVQEVERRMVDRLATVKDVDPEAVRVMVAEAVAALPTPEPGKDADPEVIRSMVAEAVAALPPAEPGSSVSIDDVRPVLAEMVAALPPPEKGADADPGVTAELVRAEVARATAGLPEAVTVAVAEAVAALPPAEPGKEGPPGKLPLVKVWADGVHYEGDVAFHEGGTWQALRDTGRSPPHDDWQCLAQAGSDGEDGRSFTVRGTWAEGGEYRALDVVALNGGAFVARMDDPGACPGEGWQMIAMQGKPGKPGERSPGVKGDRGDAGPPVLAMAVDGSGMLTLTNADGSEVTCDLYPLLAKLG